MAIRSLPVALARRPSPACRLRWLPPLLLALMLSGCLAPMALDRMSVAYNEVTGNDISKQLLLNIARAHNNQPIHFTGISNIAETLNFQGSIGATPPLTGDIGLSLMPLFGGAASENPTISIVPLQGEEFTNRLLNPLHEGKLTLLLRQNVDVDLLLRLIALEYRTRENGVDRVYHNRPRNRDGYAKFRKAALHLSSIQDRNELYAEPMIIQSHYTLPAQNMSPEGLQSLERDFEISFDPKQQVYHLAKERVGRIVLTNYDPVRLSPAERLHLHKEAELGADNDLLVDIRKEFPGGELPMHGTLRLRSLANIINFIGRTIESEREYHIPADPRTPEVEDNPVAAMDIAETEDAPPKDILYVKYGSLYYWVRPSAGYPWNQTAFRVLWQLFQMTVAEVPRTGAPSITIAK